MPLMEDLTKETRRQRELWLLAIGAALASPDWRQHLGGRVAPGDDIKNLAAAVRAGSPSVWRLLAKGWGVHHEEGALAVERIFAELDHTEQERIRTHLMNSVVQGLRDGKPWVAMLPDLRELVKDVETDEEKLVPEAREDEAA